MKLFRLYVDVSFYRTGGNCEGAFLMNLRANVSGVGGGYATVLHVNYFDNERSLSGN